MMILSRTVLRIALLKLFRSNLPWELSSRLCILLVISLLDYCSSELPAIRHALSALCNLP